MSKFVLIEFNGREILSLHGWKADAFVFAVGATVMTLIVRALMK